MKLAIRSTQQGIVLVNDNLLFSENIRIAQNILKLLKRLDSSDMFSYVRQAYAFAKAQQFSEFVPYLTYVH